MYVWFLTSASVPVFTDTTSLEDNPAKGIFLISQTDEVFVPKIYIYSLHTF